MTPDLDEALDGLLVTLRAIYGDENLPMADADLVVMADVTLQSHLALPIVMGDVPRLIESWNAGGHGC